MCVQSVTKTPEIVATLNKILQFNHQNFGISKMEHAQVTRPIIQSLILKSGLTSRSGIFIIWNLKMEAMEYITRKQTSVAKNDLHLEIASSKKHHPSTSYVIWLPLQKIDPINPYNLLSDGQNIRRHRIRLLLGNGWPEGRKLPGASKSDR